MWGSLAELGTEALDPRQLGVHPPESYRDPGFPYRQFDESDRLLWCWAYSFARRAPILVPESIAYYLAPERQDDPCHLEEISNGCALGSGLEEAILYGLLEVAERDAFLMAWYTRMPAPRIDLHAQDDLRVRSILGSMAGMGYQLFAFDITMEHDVPCIWAQAVRTTSDSRKVKTICSANAHLHLEWAVRSALTELASMIPDAAGRLSPRGERPR